jgi:hypothetical protein
MDPHESAYYYPNSLYLLMEKTRERKKFQFEFFQYSLREAKNI